MSLTNACPLSRCVCALNKSTYFSSLFAGSRLVTFSVLQKTFRLVSTTNRTGVIALEEKRNDDIGDSNNVFESPNWNRSEAVQETNECDSRQVHCTTTKATEHKVKNPIIKKFQGTHLKLYHLLKKYIIIENRLSKSYPEYVELLKALKIPVMEQVKPKPVLIDPEACRIVCKHIEDLQNSSTAIALGNPGAGIFSKELVKHGAKNLFLFETHQDLQKHLSELHRDDPGVQVLNQDLFNFSFLYTDSDYKLVNLLESEKYRKLKIIHVLRNSMQFPILLTYYNANYLPFHLKETEIFFFTRADYAMKIFGASFDSSNQSLGKYSIWRKFVKTEPVITLPADAFFPSFTTEGMGRTTNGSITLIRSTFPTLMFNGKPLTVEERHLYYLFLRHCMVTTMQPIVHMLEKWSPGIGLKLIRQGFSLFVPFANLSDEQVLFAFMTFIQDVPADSPFWSLIGGPKFHVNFSENSLSPA